MAPKEKKNKSEKKRKASDNDDDDNEKKKKKIKGNDDADVDVEEKEPAQENKKKKSPRPVIQKTYEERVKAVNIISEPLASKKSTKKIHKLVKKASSVKSIRRGVKEVIKGIRKGETGLAILAGDIYPIDVIAHIPILLEEKNVPYLFVPSKQDLGTAASTKRPTSCVLIRTPKKKEEFDGYDLYEELMEEAKEYNPTSVTLS